MPLKQGFGDQRQIQFGDIRTTARDSAPQYSGLPVTNIGEWLSNLQNRSAYDSFNMSQLAAGATTDRNEYLLRRGGQEERDTIRENKAATKRGGILGFVDNIIGSPNATDSLINAFVPTYKPSGSTNPYILGGSTVPTGNQNRQRTGNRNGGIFTLPKSTPPFVSSSSRLNPANPTLFDFSVSDLTSFASSDNPLFGSL